MFTNVRSKLLGLAGAVSILAVVFFGGYLTSWFEVQPLYKLAGRIENKLTKASGGPSETELLVDTLETTFLRLRGSVHMMPDNDWTNGGALSVWDNELLVMHHSGRMLYYSEGEGLVDTAIAAPDSGRAAYIALSKVPAYAAYSHKPKRMRFNDVTYVNDASAHGLALSYTFFDPDRVCYGTRVAWLEIDQADATPATLSANAEDWDILFESTPCLELNPAWTALDGIMAGGRMAYQGAGKLILGSGEYHLDGVHTYDIGIQSDDTDYGKVIEIDVTNGQARHVSKGHRNLQGVAVDKTGRIWVTEHGVRGGDELNLVRENGNYGWPLETLGTLYSGQPFPTSGETGRHVLHDAPVYAWLPSAAISSLTLIDGFDPTWDGDLLAGSLSSPVFGQSLFRIRIRDERVVFVERIELARRIRHLTQFGDRIALWLDTNELVLLSIEQREDPLATVKDQLAEAYDSVLAAKTERLLNSCGECHSYVQANHAGAPSLNGVVGRRVGGSSYAAYSEALASHGGTWDAAALKAYLLDPNGYISGTSMPNPNVQDDASLDALIWALDRINSTDGAHLKYN